MPSVAQNIGLVMSDTSFLEPIFFNSTLLYLCQGLQNNDICFLLFSFTDFLSIFEFDHNLINENNKLVSESMSE